MLKRTKFTIWTTIVFLIIAVIIAVVVCLFPQIGA